jgi:hypothetical protein
MLLVTGHGVELLGMHTTVAYPTTGIVLMLSLVVWICCEVQPC